MSEYENFERLLKEKGITAYRVAKETGITTATLTSWKQGKYVPKYEKLQRIADYLGVSVADIMESTASWDGPSDAPVFTIAELQLLEVFRQLNYNRQDELLQYGTFLLSRQNEERKKSSELSKEA